MGRKKTRDQAAADVLLDTVPDLFDNTPILIAEEPTGEVEIDLEERGAKVSVWRRLALGGKAAAPWPPEGPYEAVAMRMPRDKTAFEMALHASASVLPAGGTLWVFGANDEGIKSAAKRIAALFDDVRTIETRSHCRVYSAKRKETLEGLLRAPLWSWRGNVKIEMPSGERDWTIYPGVFAKGKLDPATAALIEHGPTLAGVPSVLDFGCGTGVISAAILDMCPKARIDMIDVDAVSLEAARHNVPGAKAIRLGDGWGALDGLGPQGYDFILSNPPIHIGKDRNYSTLAQLIKGAPERLNRLGELWLVTQRQTPTGAIMGEVFDKVETMWQDKRFKIWRATAP